MVTIRHHDIDEPSCIELGKLCICKTWRLDSLRMGNRKGDRWVTYHMPAEAKCSEHFLEMLHQREWNSLSLPSRLGLGLVGSIKDEVTT